MVDYVAVVCEIGFCVYQAGLKTAEDDLKLLLYLTTGTHPHPSPACVAPGTEPSAC